MANPSGTRFDVGGVTVAGDLMLGRHWRLLMGEGIVLVILGVLAIAWPFVGSLAVEIFAGWMFLIGGVLRTVTLLRARHVPGYWWSLLGAILAIIAGGILIGRPLQGILTLTIVMVALFVVEGISAIFAGLDYRHHSSNWGWLLFSGIVDLGLAAVIWSGFPGSAAWTLGLLTGINLVFLGWSLVMVALSVRDDDFSPSR